MSKGKGGSRHGGGGGGIVAGAVDDVNSIGIGSRSVSYLRQGMRDPRGRASAYLGVQSRAQANAIATGQTGSKNWGKTFDPIHVEVQYTRPGGKPHVSIQDGRHRLKGAKLGGATKIRARIDVSVKTKTGWVDKKPVVRNINIYPKGTRPPVFRPLK
jgi:hypothetical protein